MYSNGYSAGNADGVSLIHALNATGTSNPNWTTSPANPFAAVGVAFQATVPAVNYTLTGPTTGASGSASTNFTLTPSGMVSSDTVTPVG